MIQTLDYFYDGQIRRYLEQIVRAFSGYQYETGRRGDTPPQLLVVPCRMASRDRMVGHILRNNSENTLLSVPMITVELSGVIPRREDLQNPSHVDVRQIVERAIDPETGRYTDGRGASYTVERLMPRPFTMNVQIDVWTSNYEQKMQLMEQILTVIYPSFDIQNSDNPLDWSALTLMIVEDINWTSRSVPVSESEIEIATIQLKIPMWLNPPAKVKQQKLIEQIVTNIHEGRSGDEIEDASYLSRTITTPGNHVVRVEGNKIILLGPRGAEVDEGGNVYAWKPLIDLYGRIAPGTSRLRLRRSDDLDDDSLDVIGTIQYSIAENELHWQVDPDTLPANTLGPVAAVIDPLRTWPGNGLPEATIGTRYLILSDIASSTQAWGLLSAYANSIIEYTPTGWQVSFDSTPSAETVEARHYVLNLHTGRQLKWDGYDWLMALDGQYGPGMWRLNL